MKKGTIRRPARDKDLLEEYDFSKGVRGKYAARYAKGTNIVVLAADVFQVFPDSQSVNEALRTLIRLSGKKTAAKAAKPPSSRAPRA